MNESRSIFDLIKLMYLRRKARRLVMSVYSQLNMDYGDAGTAMKIALRPGIMRDAIKADEVMRQIKKLDSTFPYESLVNQLEEMAS